MQFIIRSNRQVATTKVIEKSANAKGSSTPGVQAWVRPASGLQTGRRANFMTDSQCDNFMERVKIGVKRKQVVLGKERLFKLAKAKQISLVWATEDLSKNSFGKLRIACQDYDIPILHWGHSEDVGSVTGHTETKVYIFRKSFAGIRQVLRELDDALH